MKFDEFDPSINEVRMGASDLTSFVTSELAQGIRAGFEAELCFSNMGGSDGEDDEMNPDFEADRTARSFDAIVSFFHDGDHNSRSDAERLREKLLEDYLEWRSTKAEEMWDDAKDEAIRDYISENVFDYFEAIEEYLEDELELNKEEIAAALRAGKMASEITNSKQLNLFAEDNLAFERYAEARDHAQEELDNLIEETLSSNNKYYELAKESWMDAILEDDDLNEREFLEANELDVMSSIYHEYTDYINWPYWETRSNESGNSYEIDNARTLARYLEKSLDITVKASDGYHSVKRDNVSWIIEPDSSIEAADGDMPAEIISPPMPLADCITKLREFAEWAKGEDAYTNNSTGLHVGVSLPNVGGNVDYLKLALFLGDRYVLDTFDRASNSYCESSLQKIESDIQNYKSEVTINNALADMRNGLIQFASNSVARPGHGKYSSINLKGDYIEFRSMGGPRYLDNIEIVVNMIQRFAMAMTIAADPNSYRQEYAKKLYKLLSTKNTSQNVIELFSKYAAGQLPKVELKSFIRQAQLERQSTREPGKKMWWIVRHKTAGHQIELVASNAQEAKQKAAKELNFSTSGPNDALGMFDAKPSRPYVPD